MTGQKGGMNMSDKEKEILSKVAQAVPKMNDFEKGYMLGVIDTKLDKPNKNPSRDPECAYQDH